MTDISRALSDRRLLGAAIGDLTSWQTWLCVLRAAFGLPLSEADLQTFRGVAGDRVPPMSRVRELWAVVSRRSGKSRMAAALACYLGLFVKHRLARGEIGHCLVLASTQDQAKTVLEYANGFIQSSEALRGEVRAVTQSEIRLANNVIIGSHVNNFRTIRGKTLLGIVFDECSFWRDEGSANPDLEVYRAAMPSLLASGGMLIGISTPYRRQGLLYTKHRDHFGQDSDEVLVVQGIAEQFNPLLSAELIAAQRMADPEAAISEWDAQFRTDITAFLSEDLIELAIDRSRPPELTPMAGTKYHTFVDASGGRHDDYTVCIGHKDAAGRFVCDTLKGFHPPFDPHYATQAIALLAREFGCEVVVGDNYSADWIVAAFKDCGLRYQRAEKNRSELYLEGLPQFTRGLVRLPEHQKLERELRLLERHVSRVGRDLVDHGRNGSDDYANSLFGCLHLAMSGAGGYRASYDWLYGGDETPDLHAPYSDYEQGRSQMYRELAWACYGMQTQFPWKR